MAACDCTPEGDVARERHPRLHQEHCALAREWRGQARDTNEKGPLIALVEEALGKGATQTATLVLAAVDQWTTQLAALEREHAEVVAELDEFYTAVDDNLPDIDVSGEGDADGSRIERIEYAGAALEASEREVERWRDRAEYAEQDRDAKAAELATLTAERDRLLLEVERLRAMFMLDKGIA